MMWLLIAVLQFAVEIQSQNINDSISKQVLGRKLLSTTPALTFGFEYSNYIFSESVGTAILGVRTSSVVTHDFAFTFNTRDGSAVANEDYVASTNVEYTFIAGETRLDIPVGIIDDSVRENSEQFLGLLSTSDGTQIDTPNATVTITGSLALGFDPNVHHVNEGEMVLLRILLDMPFTEVITVSLQTQDGSAETFSDYTELRTSVTFSPGDIEQTVAVTTLEDSLTEGDETFTAALSSITPADTVVIAGASATITIVDNDHVEVTSESVMTLPPDSSTEGDVTNFTTEGPLQLIPSSSAITTIETLPTTTLTATDSVDSAGEDLFPIVLIASVVATFILIIIVISLIVSLVVCFKRRNDQVKATIHMMTNEAYGVILQDMTTSAEESAYSYPSVDPASSIEARQNEAYATNTATQRNVAYRATNVTTGESHEFGMYDYI